MKSEDIVKLRTIIDFRDGINNKLSELTKEI